MDRVLDPGVVTNLLNAFTLVLTGGGFARLMPDAMWLLQRLAILDIIVAALWWGLCDDDIVVAFLAKIFWIGVFIWLVTIWPTLTKALVTSFIQIGLKGAGGVLTVEDFSNPARIAKFGFEVVAVLNKKITLYSGLWSLMNPMLMFIESVTFVGVTLAFGMIAIQIFITFVEFYLVALLSLILVPFGVFRHTAFIAEKAIGSVVAFGIKLMVLAAIANMMQPVMVTLKLSAEPQLNELMSLLLGSLALALLAWHAPGVAAGMMAGAPTLTASTVIHTTIGAAAGAGLAGVGVMAAGQTLAAGTRRAVRYGSATVAAFQTGGMRGIGQTAKATGVYHAQKLTAGMRNAAVAGRVYGTNFAAVPWNAGSPGARAASPVTASMLAMRVVPPQAHPQGGVQASIHRP